MKIADTAADLADRSAHFEFGENWRDYARSIDQSRIDQSIAGLKKLFPDGLSGKSVIDIGCGSGLHAAAALALGAASVTAIDLDENSTSTTQALLSRIAPDKTWTVRTASVFDLKAEDIGRFDLVYSWGVLHHTGDMWRTIERAATLVKPGGLFVIAIYTKTPACEFWRREKRFYKSAPGFVQWMMRTAYMSAFLGFLPVTGWRPIAFVRNYKKSRGMNFSNDVHDWLGGYPYESASVAEVQAELARLKLEEVRTFGLYPTHGIWGAGCSEYVYRRPLPG
jgi:SAM-dependent methyltransferase